jgi:hypothetical protein
MPAEILLRNLTRKYVEDQLVKHGVDHLVEIEARPQGLLVRVPAVMRAEGEAPPSDGQRAHSEPRKIVATSITDGELADAERELGKIRFGTRHLLTIEVPAHYGEEDITAAAIARDPAITVIARSPQLAPEPEPAPPPPPAPSRMPAPIAMEPAADKQPTKIVHTQIADELGRFLVIEVPEDYDEDELTPEAIAADPAISIVSRAKPQLAPEPEPAPVPVVTASAPVALEPVAERTPTKIVHTTIADPRGRYYVIEVPEDFDASALTAETVEGAPGVSIVARVTPPPVVPELEPLPVDAHLDELAQGAPAVITETDSGDRVAEMLPDEPDGTIDVDLVHIDAQPSGGEPES